MEPSIYNSPNHRHTHPMSDKIAWKEQKDQLYDQLMKMKDRKRARDLDCVFSCLLLKSSAGPKSQCLMLWLRICEIEEIVVDMVLDYKDRSIGFLGISSFTIPSDKVGLFNSGLFLDPFHGETWNKQFWRRCGFAYVNDPVKGISFTFNNVMYVEMHPHLKKRGADELLAPLQAAAESLLCDEVMSYRQAIGSDDMQLAVALPSDDKQPAVASDDKQPPVAPAPPQSVVAKDIGEIKLLIDAARQAKLDAQNEAAAEIAKAEALEMYAKALQELEVEAAKVKKAKTRTEAAMAKIAELEGKK